MLKEHDVALKLFSFVIPRVHVNLSNVRKAWLHTTLIHSLYLWLKTSCLVLCLLRKSIENSLLQQFSDILHHTIPLYSS